MSMGAYDEAEHERRERKASEVNASSDDERTESALWSTRARIRPNSFSTSSDRFSRSDERAGGF